MIKIISFLLFFFYFQNCFSASLKIEGLNKLSKTDIQSLTKYDLDKDDFDTNKINIVFRDLIKSDLIFDIELITKSEEFIFIIEEYKLINQIFFNGNSYVQSDLFNQFIVTKTNDPLDKDKILADIKTIRQIYKSKGFNNISVNTISESLSNNRVNVIFDINEGSQSTIQRILFQGNSSFTDKYLYSKINSKELNFYNIFTSGSNFNYSLFEFDKNLIIEEYKNNGFFDVNINYELASFRNNNYNLTFFINEGVRRKVVKINYDSNYLKNENELNKIIKKLELEIVNSYFSKKKIEKLINSLNSFLLKRNINNFFYSFEIFPNGENLNINIVQNNDKPRVINQISIEGNTITKDQTIRSRIPIQPGDIINSYRLKESVNSLKVLKYVNEVNVIEKKIDEKFDLTFEIEENKKTGNFLFGGSFSGDTGIGLGFSIQDYNFLGSGNEFNAKTDFNSERALFTIGYSSYLKNYPKLKNNYVVFNQNDDLVSSYGYKVDRLGVEYSLSFDYSNKTYLSAGFKVQEKKSHSGYNNNSYITDSIGKFNQFVINLVLDYDNTNDRLYPTSGFKNSLRLNISPEELSDDNFYKLIYRNQFFYNLNNSKNFFFISNYLGLADSINENQKLKTINNFSLGGNNFKGFQYRGIGPADGSIYLGGNKVFTTTIGYGSSFIFDEKDNVNIRTFLSSGSLWDSDYASDNEFYLRQSIGLSFDILTAVGPVSFSYAVPLRKKSYDNTREFNFSIGTSF